MNPDDWRNSFDGEDTKKTAGEQKPSEKEYDVDVIGAVIDGPNPDSEEEIKEESQFWQ